MFVFNQWSCNFVTLSVSRENATFAAKCSRIVYFPHTRCVGYPFGYIQSSVWGTCEACVWTSVQFSSCIFRFEMGRVGVVVVLVSEIEASRRSAQRSTTEHWTELEFSLSLTIRSVVRLSVSAPLALVLCVCVYCAPRVLSVVGFKRTPKTPRRMSRELGCQAFVKLKIKNNFKT